MATKVDAVTGWEETLEALHDDGTMLDAYYDCYDFDEDFIDREHKADVSAFLLTERRANRRLNVAFMRANKRIPIRCKE